MGGRQIGRFLELAVYPLSGRVEMFIQQVELDELIDQPQVIRRDLGSFFKGLACFVISSWPGGRSARGLCGVVDPAERASLGRE